MPSINTIKLPDRNYADSDDKFLRQVVFYIDGNTDNYIYTDDKFTTKVNGEYLIDFLRKGIALFCQYNGTGGYTYYRESGFTYVKVPSGTVVNCTIDGETYCSDNSNLK